MDGVVWKIKKEGILFKLSKDLNGFIRQPVGQVFPFRAILEIRVFVRAKVRGGMPPGISGNIDINSLGGRILSHMPFPHLCGAVARPLEFLGDSNDFILEMQTVGRGNKHPVPGISPL